MRQIQKDLSKCDIVEEVFSKCASWSVVIFRSEIWFSLVDRYPEIRNLELRQLARVLLSPDSAPTSQLLKKNIRRYTQGEFPHAKHVISTLYNLMENDESVEETPLPEVAAPIHDTVSEDWAGLKKALTSSLTSGTFLDSQFYAVASRSSSSLPKIRAIYFCSAAGDSFPSKLLAGKILTQFTCGWICDRSF